ncbi:uncharacterized protein P884DRAFT_243152 [Thermothelomyces heterothallicus CBS 202.75]|uniref:uncharacterized protein n=1 Tax=Thermothelomyces heterothallicus CBS 202.75 TaxID=1149848 RepID=UPI00374246F3
MVEMRLSAVACCSLAAGVASASRQGTALIPGSSSPGFGLLARQNPFCTTESTCAECFGEGYVVCDDIGCFNPDEDDQCCAGAVICVGRDNSCYRDDTGEECCQRAPNPPLHWCSGDFPNFRCYNPKNQFCCTNGKVCDEKDCCALFNESTTHPWSSARSSTAGPSSSSSSSPATGTVTQAPTSATAAATADSSSTSTTSTGAGSVSGPSYIALGLAALGLALSY